MAHTITTNSQLALLTYSRVFQNVYLTSKQASEKVEKFRIKFRRE